MQEIGEIAGPALAGILWQTGGVSALFGVRIAIAIVAEISAITVFCELQNYRPRLRILTWFARIGGGGAFSLLSMLGQGCH